MKEFFLNLLNNLDKLAGLRQIENIYAAHGDANEARKEINTLLDVLVNMCAQFTYIPEAEQKKIINHCVITDPEFKNLNARIVYKWLNAQKDKYYKELAHQETQQEKDWVPVPKDSPAYDEYCKQWLAALKPMEERINVASKEVNLLGKPREGRTDYTPLPENEVTRREKHIRYLKANYDSRTREKLLNYLSEEEWNLLND